MDQSSKIVLLFDYFSMESRNLYESFTNVGIPFTAAVVEDDGFLPEGVNSVYGYFCTQGAVAREEHPRYFNQIQVPEYWRIESTNTSGKVMDKTKERARIFYTEPTNHRLPLRYNNDKQKKPLFSRGLSVCRLLFNSFSKLKIDENYKEKRRLFY